MIEPTTEAAHPMIARIEHRKDGSVHLVVNGKDHGTAIPPKGQAFVITAQFAYSTIRTEGVDQ